MKKLCLSFFIVLTPLLMYAWNPSGHWTGGAVAYYYLKANKPAAIPKILETLSHHPWYNSKWADDLFGLKGEEREVTIFMLAAEYPDEIKKFKVMDDKTLRPWHRVNYPFEPKNQSVPVKQPVAPNAETKLVELLGKIKDEKETDQKAIDLCWIFHLIGETHDPLHTASLFDVNHKDGDDGGNGTFIIFKKGAPAVTLFSYWEELPTGTLSDIRTTGKVLLQKYPEAGLTELTTNKTVADWIKNESFAIATKDVYLDGKVNGTRSNPTLLDATYSATAKEIETRRVTLSGIRLAKKLIDIY